MQFQHNKVWLSRSDCDIENFRQLVNTDYPTAAMPIATEIQQRIPVYSGSAIAEKGDDPDFQLALLSEWNRVFEHGAGIIVIKNAFPDTFIVDQVTAVLNKIINTESSDSPGDHFAEAGANSRVWNSHEKLALANPELFAAYYANPVIHLASCAWLGPNYQITAQVNVVHPGGRAQVCHRDYHLGFQSIDQLSAYPCNVQKVSPHLTLQGAIAHSSMTLESGPTKVLPYSQKYMAGYMAAQLPEFRDYFEEHNVQLPLATGDMMFFNPATFHAAGDNNTANDRFANLLQIGSAFTRTTELVNRTLLCRLLYPVLLKAKASLTQQQVNYVVAATAEGYAFPCNLDLTPPIDGLAPVSQQEVMLTALLENVSTNEFNESLDRWVSLQRSQ